MVSKIPTGSQIPVKSPAKTTGAFETATCRCHLLATVFSIMNKVMICMGLWVMGFDKNRGTCPCSSGDLWQWGTTIKEY